MIDKDGALRCDSCNKEILLYLKIIEGESRFFCPRCRYYQELRASTSQVGNLTTDEKCASVKKIAP